MTKEGSVKAWTSGVSNALGDAGLNLLINNAGILTPGPIEVLPLDAIRREFDVNVFGALLVMNGYLPALRKALAALSRSAPGPPACRFRSLGPQARPRRPWKCSPPSTR